MRLSPSRLELLRHRIGRATDICQRLRRTADFLQVCRTVLQSPNHQRYPDVLLEVAYLLGERCCDAAVWDWLQELALTTDDDLRIALRIAILELVPDPPICWPHLFRLWDMGFDARTRWAVYAAYHPFPRRVHGHLRRYNAHRRRHTLPAFEFSQEEFDRVLKQHAHSPESNSGSSAGN